MHAPAKALSALALFASITALPAAAGQRTFVASFGSDVNTATSCTLANPCRGFAAAQTVTSNSGEIVALDAAGYGAITITKSITITANPGFYAGIAVSTGDAVTIATPGVTVILRGLNINYVGIAGGAASGVAMTNGSALSIENCVISNFSGGNGVGVDTAAKVRITDSLVRDNSNGIHVSNGATAVISGSKVLGNSSAGIDLAGNIASTVTTATIDNTVASFNGGAGIQACASNAAATVKASVIRATLASNGYGVIVDSCGGTQVAVVSYSIASGNTIGFFNNPATGNNQFLSLGNNDVHNNTGNTSGTISIVNFN